MRFINICAILICCLPLGSCKKYLDIKPKGSSIPATVADFDHLLDNYGTAEYYFRDNNSGSVISHLTDNVQLSEGQAKVAFLLNNFTNMERYYGYTFRHPYRNPTGNDFFWSSNGGIYSNARYFNSVIEGIRDLDNLSSADQQQAKRVIAQALAARAWAYFNGNILYGPVYKPGLKNDTKTIPYITKADITAPNPQLSSQEEMFSHVLSDLHQSLADIPETSSWPSRPNKAAVQAMLAYCHLFKQNYDSVAYYANQAWSSASGGSAGKLIYDYNRFSWATPANPVVSQIVAEDNRLNVVNSKEMLFYRGTEQNAGVNMSYPSDEIIASFDQANDLRFKFFFLTAPGYRTSAGGGFDDGPRIFYYRAIKSKLTDGITYPELLLMRAEGYARTNKLAEAIADLNTLRTFRYKTGTPPLVAGSQEQVINLVLQERRRELPLGGIKRFMDLKRLVLEPGKPWAKAQVKHQVGSQTYTGSIDSPDFTFNILNTVLQFNPSWGIPLDTRSF